MTNEEAFKIWAPGGVKWTDWVRPVPFAAADVHTGTDTYEAADFTIPKIDYIKTEKEADNLPSGTVVIVDLPGQEGIQEALALAELGFRPIPLYNGTYQQPGALALVDNHSIRHALFWGAPLLAQISIAEDAPPAFLLDSNRMHIHRADNTVFDNSWDIYEQDMPSGVFIRSSGIEKIIVRGMAPKAARNAINRDLRKILYKYQKKGIKIFYTNGYDMPECVILKKIKGT